MHKSAIIMLIILLCFSSAFSQNPGGTDTDTSKTQKLVFPHYAPPKTDTKLMGEAGIGIGIPYGIIGGRVSLGTSLVTGDIGLGIHPLIAEPAFTAGGSIHLGNRYSSIRPKITAVYSNIVSAIMLLKESSFNSLYDETFEGVAAYAGLDWRLGKTSNLCIDLNIGWIFPFVGNNEIRRRYNKAKEDLKAEGYYITSELVALDTPKLSMGIVYSFGRKLKFIY